MISDPKPPFDRLGDYEVLAPIAEGGMASVWLGRSAAGELVALKVIREDHGRNKDFVAMLVDEAGIASRMSHANILSIRGMGHDGKRHFLVMDLLRGHSLLEVLKEAHARGKRLPLAVAAWMVARIADALDYAHELRDERGAPSGVVHRDVNPANIFITNEGVPKLIDFGLAKARDRIASTAIGVVKGKLAYLSPEQVQGHAADRRTDVFALGVTFWEMTLDRRLFLDGSDVETVRRVREAAVPDPRTLEAGYPDALADAVLRAVARRPDERWQTAAAFRDTLDAFVNGADTPADASSMRAVLHDLFANETPPSWARLADAAAAEQERTKVWVERMDTAPEAPRPVPAAVVPAPPMATVPAATAPFPRPVAVALGVVVLGGLLVGLLARVGRTGDGADLEQRVSRIEDLLGLADAGVAAATRSAPGPEGSSTTSVGDRVGPCAIAKVAGYEAWQEAVARAKLNERPVEAACGEIWSEKKKQACYFAATAEARTLQAARDAVMAGGASAREMVKAVKTDPKNDAIEPAQRASEAALAACGEEPPAP
jgi:serine/threonine-protein kinase